MPAQTSSRRIEIEAEVVEGLELVAHDEINEKLTQSHNLQQNRRAIRFIYQGQLEDLLHLKTVTAVYIIESFQIPRPKALLGHENFHRILDTIEYVKRIQPTEAFKTLHISAAGSNSSVMRRIKSELARHARLEVGSNEGDLFLRVRRVRNQWEVLVRVSARPLSTRDWRVCNMEGALNASVAHAMVRLLNLKPEDQLLNLMSGSGSLLIEGATYSDRLFSCDLETEALQCGSRNIQKAGLHQKVALFQADARVIPIGDGQMSAIVMDLPFGHLIGSHDENVELYPKVLDEAYRVARLGCQLALVTHEKKLMEQLLRISNWTCRREIMITLRGLHPHIYLLRKPGIT